MFTTTQQAAATTAHAVQKATAFGLAALVTLSILASISQLATTPAANSYLAQTAQTPARA